jgi:hypothetical protein
MDFIEKCQAILFFIQVRQFVTTSYKNKYFCSFSQ